MKKGIIVNAEKEETIKTAAEEEPLEEQVAAEAAEAEETVKPEKPKKKKSEKKPKKTKKADVKPEEEFIEPEKDEEELLKIIADLQQQVKNHLQKHQKQNQEKKL